jgi:hypothetical protein
MYSSRVGDIFQGKIGKRELQAQLPLAPSLQFRNDGQSLFQGKDFL